MKRWLPFPLLWSLLAIMWLVLYQTLEAGQVILGGVVAICAVRAYRALQEPMVSLRRPRVMLELVWLVFTDIVRSNIAVARVVLYRRAAGHRRGFVEIPLDLRNPAGLAALACIITSTPGTAWAGYDSGSGVMTLHILDLVDEDTWVRTIKDRYERRLMEIFE